VKTDRRGAVTMARLLRAGELAGIWILDEEHEAIRVAACGGPCYRFCTNACFPRPKSRRPGRLGKVSADDTGAGRDRRRRRAPPKGLIRQPP
jgi:hypothetical protein